MPTSKLQTLLEKAGVKTGDRISVLKENKKYEGVLMPKTDAGDPNCIIIKLDSGYNIGLVPEKIDLISSGIKKIEKEEHKIKYRKDLPKISILHTGGTIASKVDYRTGSAFASFSPDDLIDCRNSKHRFRVNSKHVERRLEISTL